MTRATVVLFFTQSFSAGRAPLVVRDEIVGMPVALIALPLSLATVLAVFALFGLFDIWKPWPIGCLAASSKAASASFATP